MSEQEKTEQELAAAAVEAEAKGKEAEKNTKAPKVTDATLDKGAKSVGAQLAKQKKHKVKLYLSVEERQKLEAAEKAGKKVKWPYETVNINGYTFQIQRGKEVEVPEAVYEVLSNANII